MENIYEILPRYFNNQCTAEEIKGIKQWKKENPAEYKEHETIWQLTENQEYIDFDTPSAWKELQAQLKTSSSNTTQTTKVVPLALWKKIAVAAAIILVCGLGITQFMGNEGAEGQLFAEGNNTTYTNTTRGKEMVTQKEVQSATLKSGDKVWMNRNTKIEDIGSKDGQYAVKVHKGEAFFDVNSRADKAEPFMVHTKNAAVSVIGTQFSVASRKNGQTIIRVVEGVVKVKSSDINEISLKAGEQAYIIDGNIQRFDKYSPNYLAWKTGKFDFQNVPIAKVALLLQTFYETKVEVVEGTKGHTTGKFDVLDIGPLLEQVTLVSGVQLEVIKADKHYRISNK